MPRELTSALSQHSVQLLTQLTAEHTDQYGHLNTETDVLAFRMPETIESNGFNIHFEPIGDALVPVRTGPVLSRLGS